MELFRMIKSDARRAMRFCGGRAVAAMMAVLLAGIAVNLTESVLLLVFCGMEALTSNLEMLVKAYPAVVPVVSGTTLLWFFVVPAILLGYKKLHLSFAEGNDESILMIFENFSSPGRFLSSFFFALGYAVRLLLTFAIAVFPGGAFLWFFENYIPEGTRTLEILKIAACGTGIMIMILCVALAIIFVQRWHLAFYYFGKGEGIGKSFSLSAKATKGLHTKILSLKFSFIGWGILSVFVLPLLWAVPYYELSNAIFAKYLMERYERSLAEVPETIDPNFSSEETD